MPDNPTAAESALEVSSNYGCVGWVGMILFLGAAFFSWHEVNGAQVSAIIFLLFGLLAAYLITANATLKVDTHCIEASSRYGKSRILWDEVQKVTLDNFGDVLVFHGPDKRLVFAGPTIWRKKGRAEMLNFLETQREKRDIPFEDRPRSNMKVSRNVRVRS